MRPSKRVLTIKPPRTRSSTEVNCSESNTNLGSDEVAEPEAEAISKENSDANSLGSNKSICVIASVCETSKLSVH